MAKRPTIEEAVRTGALATILAAILVGGVQVARQIEKDVVEGVVAASSAWPRPTGSGTILLLGCYGSPGAPVDPCGLAALPFLIASFLPSRRLVTLRLRD